MARPTFEACESGVLFVGIIGLEVGTTRTWHTVFVFRAAHGQPFTQAVTVDRACCFEKQSTEIKADGHAGASILDRIR